LKQIAVTNDKLDANMISAVKNGGPIEARSRSLVCVRVVEDLRREERRPH